LDGTARESALALGFPRPACQTYGPAGAGCNKRGGNDPHPHVTIPNLITIGRLFLVPLTIWLIVSSEHVLAFWAFVIAGVSDGVDGFIARSFNQRSDLGAYLDPIADKALLVSIYVTFAITGVLPVWLAILVVSRDLLIVGGVVLSWMVGQPVEIRPRAISKINTAFQIALAAVVLADQAFARALGWLPDVLIIVVGLLTLSSAVVYAIDWVRHMSEGVPPSADPLA
jgi:cardiolipin synthase